MSEATPRLIKCGDHQMAPWCIVCRHLLEGTATQWEPVPQAEGSEVEFDWLCPECKRRLPGVDEEQLAAVCIHCVKALQSNAGS